MVGGPDKELKTRRRRYKKRRRTTNKYVPSLMGLAKRTHYAQGHLKTRHTGGVRLIKKGIRRVLMQSCGYTDHKVKTSELGLFKCKGKKGRLTLHLKEAEEEKERKGKNKTHTTR